MHLARAAAKLTYAFANATVPKVNVIVWTKPLEAPYRCDEQQVRGCRYCLCMANSRDRNDGCECLQQRSCMQDADACRLSVKKQLNTENFSQAPNSAAGRGYVDAIIEPADTRKYVIGAFEMLFTKREDRPVKKARNGLVR